MKVVIMAAGLSTRLLPLTESCPKPMLKVQSRPMIEHVILSLVNQGFSNIIITLYYKPEVIVNYFKDGSNFRAHIEYSYEEELLGTAGSIKKLENLLDDDFLVCSGSYLLDKIDFQDLIKTHKRKDALGTIVLGKIPAEKDLKNFGQAILDQQNRVVRFQEKPRKSFSHWVHTTYQIYSPKIFEYIPSNKYYSIPDDLIPNILDSGKLYGYKYDEMFWGISTYESYIRTKRMLESNKEFI